MQTSSYASSGNITQNRYATVQNSNPNKQNSQKITQQMMGSPQHANISMNNYLTSKNNSYQIIQQQSHTRSSNISQSPKKDNRSSKSSLIQKKNGNSISNQSKNCYNLMKGVRTQGLTPQSGQSSVPPIDINHENIRYKNGNNKKIQQSTEQLG